MIFVIPERRILVYVAAMITGIILVMRFDAVRKLPQLIQSHKVEYQNVQSPNLLSHYVAELSVTTIAAAAIVLMIIVLAFIVLAGGQLPCVAAAPGCDGYNIGAAKQRRSIFPDQSGQPTLNLNIIGLEIAGLISRVFSLQSDTAGLFQQRLQRGFLLLDQCHHNIPVIGCAGAFDHHRITFKDAGLYHRIADNFQRKMLTASQHACRHLGLVAGVAQRLNGCASRDPAQQGQAD